LKVLGITLRENNTKQIRVLLVEDNAVSARFAKAMLTQVEDQSFHIQFAETLLAALDLLARDTFDAALLDLNLPDSHGLDTFRTIQRYAPALPIIVLTGLDDETVALSAVQQGAQDFLAKGTLNKENLVRALNYAIARSRKPSETAGQVEDKAEIIGLLGSNGGVGTTTLACHCALELAQTGKKVLLVDLDVSSAGASFLMKVNSPYTALGATQNLHRLDANLWKGITCSPRERVDLLQAPGAVGIGDALDAGRVRHILRFARSLYGWIVVDLGRLTASKLAILEETKDLFIVTTPHLPALYEARSLLQKVLDAGFSREKLRLLLNRQTKGMSISVDQVEKALSYSVYASIADDSAEMNYAYADRRFLDDKLLVRKQIAQVMRKFRGIEEEPPVRFGLGFLRSG
jgi:Flp pilus assembly CpaE family ATPase